MALAFAKLGQSQNLWIQGPQEVCVGDCATYTLSDLDSLGVAEVSWSIEPNITNDIFITQFGAAATVCWDFAPGFYQLQAVVFLPTGEVVTVALDVFVNEFFFLEIYSNANEFCPGATGMNCEKVCEYSTVTYFVENAQGIWIEWDISGAESFTVINQFSVEVQWGAAGNGYINILGFVGNGCETNSGKCVNIIASPDADFATLPNAANGQLSVCQGQTIYFENQSVDALYYAWSFGDGNQSELTNPEHAYQNQGTYEILLIAKNECLCSDTSSVLVEVIPAVSPQINCVGTICEVDTFTYMTDAMCSSFIWNVSSNGTIVEGGTSVDDYISIIWNNGPMGNIELIVDNCTGNYCLEPNIVQIPIMSGNALIEGKESVCFGTTTNYSIQHYSATYYQWSVTGGQIINGQGTNEVSIDWSTNQILPNTGEIAVSYDNCYLECSGNTTLNVDILDEYRIKGPVEICQGEVAFFENRKIHSSGSFSGDWKLLDNLNNEIWSFSNATDVNIPIPDIAGVYTVVLSSVNNNEFCSEELTHMIRAVEKTESPNSIEGEILICPGETFTYEAASNISDAEFKWYINNGTITEEKIGNPINITWEAIGPFSVSVTQTHISKLPCESDPITKIINPILNFSLTGADMVCDQSFNAYQADDIDFIDYEWSLIPEDAGTIISMPGSHEIEVQWNQPGIVNLIASVCGLSETIQVEVFQLPEPTVNFPSELCANQLGLVTINGAYDGYKWSKEDNVQIGNQDQIEVLPGSYELIVTDINGCTGNTYFTIEKLPIPNIRLSSPDDTGICLTDGDPYPTLYALDADLGLTYEWLKDGTPIGFSDAIYLTNDYGDYQVEVTDHNGCKNISNIVTVFEWCNECPGGTCTGGTCNQDYCDNPDGSIDYSFVSGAQCNEILFTSLAINPDPGSLFWDFDDPNSGSENTNDLRNPVHIFTNAGFYIVYHSVFVDDLDNPGVKCNIWRAVPVEIPMVAKFDLDKACPGEMVSFFDISTFVPGNDIISWEWDFGDPLSGLDNASTLQNPDHIFDNAGSYTVSLTVSDGNCISIYTETIEVYPDPIITILDPLVSCAGTEVLFEALTDQFITEWEWDFGDINSGSANTQRTNPSYHVFMDSGNYNIKLNIINIYGCSSVVSKTISIVPNLISGTITSDNNNPMCEGETAQLTAPSGAVSWLWSTGAVDKVISVVKAGVYELTIYDADGCEYVTEAYEQEIYPVPNNTIRAVLKDEFLEALDYYYDFLSVCEGENVFLEVIETPGQSYIWSDGEAGDETAYTTERGNLLDPGTFQFQVTVTDDISNCENTIGPFEVVVYPIPDDIELTTSHSGYLCEGAATTIEVSNVDLNLNYYWNNGEIGTSITVEMAGNYFVKAVSIHGCEKWSEEISVHQAPDIGFIPDGCRQRCEPDTLCLPNIPNIASFQWFYNGTIVPAPNGTSQDFIAELSGVYCVELTDIYGCVAKSEPYDLELIDAKGDITGLVYLDENENGVIDTGDSLLEDAVLTLINSSVTTTSSADSNDQGEFEFLQVDSKDYDIAIDLSDLGSSYMAYEQIQKVQLSGCDATANVVFLVYKECINSRRDTTHFVCFGDQVIIDNISYEESISFESNYINDLGCDSIVVRQIIVGDEISFDSDTENSCFNDNTGSIGLSQISGGFGIYSFALNDGVFSTSSSFETLGPGTYQITVKDSLGCTKSIELNVMETEAIAYQLEVPIMACYDDFVTVNFNELTDDVQILWEDGTNGLAHSYEEEGQYMVRLTNECEKKDIVFNIEHEEHEEKTIYVPNVFSPDGDSFNDEFCYLTNSTIDMQDINFVIFDRWGNKVFQSNQFKDSWTGNYKGKEAIPGVYTWNLVAKVKDCREIRNISQKGNITLIR